MILPASPPNSPFLLLSCLTTPPPPSPFSLLLSLTLAFQSLSPLQLRLAVVEALGLMSHILVKEKLEEILPRLIPGMLALYKKFTSDMLPLTQVMQSENPVCTHLSNLKT